MPAAEHWVSYVQAGDSCTVAGVVPLAAPPVQPCDRPAPNWIYVEHDPPNTLRDKGFPAQLHMTPNAT